MNREDAQRELDEWLKSRPECVQRLAAEFPLGTELWLGGKVHYLIGYTEDDMLIVSHINPSFSHDGAMRVKKYVCAEHFRPPAKARH